MKPFIETKQKSGELIATLLGFFLIFLIWYTISVFQNNEVIFPNLGQTLISLTSLATDFHSYIMLFNTFGGLILVLLLSLITSILLALISLRWSYIKAGLTPVMALFKIVPVPTLIILFLANFKQTLIPYLLTYLILIPLIYDGLYGALISIDQDIKDEVKMTSSINMHIIFKVYLPIIAKGLISTLLQAFGLGLKLKVMTEFIAEAPNTIGYALSYARATLSMDVVFAWSLVLITIVILIDFFLVRLLKRQA